MHGRVNGLAATIPAHLHPGLTALLWAWLYAEDLQRDPWDFAVELPALQDAGVSVCDLRWLMAKHYVTGRVEETPPGAIQRSFRRMQGLELGARACFVLTRQGLAVVRGVVSAKGNGRLEGAGPAASWPASGRINAMAVELPDRPKWCAHGRELCWKDWVIKRFRVPSPNQEQVLQVFEEEQWPRRIDDPLPRTLGIDPKRRLNDTIKSLNRFQRWPRIKFQGDGTGEGVCWSAEHDLSRPDPALWGSDANWPEIARPRSTKEAVQIRQG